MTIVQDNAGVMDTARRQQEGWVQSKGGERLDIIRSSGKYIQPNRSRGLGELLWEIIGMVILVRSPATGRLYDVVACTASVGLGCRSRRLCVSRSSDRLFDHRTSSCETGRMCTPWESCEASSGCSIHHRSGPVPWE